MKKLILLFLFAVHLMAVELISPIEDDLNVDLNKALLGKRLFMDPQLSDDNTISCASCHLLNEGGDDNRQFSIGVNNKMGILTLLRCLIPNIILYNFGMVELKLWKNKCLSLYTIPMR